MSDFDMSKEILPDGSEYGLKGHSSEPTVRVRRGLAPERAQIDRKAPYKRIAVEEAWAIPEMVEAQLRLLGTKKYAGDPSLSIPRMFGAFPNLASQLYDIGEGRIAVMDELAIDHAVLSITTPGPQALEADEGTALARLSNDRLATACAKYPDRYSGLVAFQPLNVEGACREIERGMKDLGLNGAILNSHFHGQYIDEGAYDEILATLEENDAALYIHPTGPNLTPKAYDDRALAGPSAGFQHDVWLHLLGVIFSGAFDKYPKLRIVIGHLGEALPLHLYRLDWMQANSENIPGLRGGQPAVKLKHPVSYYFKNNIWITTSGVPWEPAIKFCMDVLGPDRVLYAMDYPYEQYRDGVAAYDRMDISPEHKKMLMQTNSEKVFRL